MEGQDGTTAYGSASHVRVDHYQHAGISVAGPGDGPRSHVSVTGNVLTGGWQIPSFQVGMWIDVGAVVRITGNVVTRNVCGGPGCGPDPINEGQGIGVFLINDPAGTRVDHNLLVGNDVGINEILSPDCCRIDRNTLLGNRYFGVVIQDGDGTTDANRILGGGTGIAVVADQVDTTGILRHDRIAGTTAAPVREIECCGYDAVADVRR